MPNCVNTVLLQTEAAACLPTTLCNTAPKEQPKTPEKHVGHQQSGIWQWRHSAREHTAAVNQAIAPVAALLSE